MSRKILVNSGDKFGRLTIMSEVNTPKGKKGRYFLCKCRCGNVREYPLRVLRNGTTTSCGCYSKESRIRYYFINKGTHIGKLTVTKFNIVNSLDEKIEFRCDCGKIKNINLWSVLFGKTYSCGCYVLEKNSKLNGISKTRVYSIFRRMKERCYNPKNKRYSSYGARGIRICNEWLNKNDGIVNFYNWSMSHGYKDNLTIDRIDVNGNYSPNNCRWITNKEQQNNKTNNVYITYKGERKTISQWAEFLGVNKSTLDYRIIRYNWPLERAFNEPVQKHFRRR